MNPRARCIWVVILLLGSLATAQPVVFNDANLKTRVEAALGLDNPSADDMLALTLLNAANQEIRDLTGLETALNLQTLYLYNNQISHLSALSGLTNLTTLALHNNRISDIAPLSGLTNMTQLSLGNNQISDISTLSVMTDLQNLSVNGNHISDITALSGMTGLVVLEANNNLIMNVSVLSALSYLTWIDLDHNFIQNIADLASLMNVQFLDVSDNPLYTTVCDEVLPVIVANNPNAEIYFDECTHIPPPPSEYTLTLLSSEGGSVTVPGEGVYGPYIEGTLVTVRAETQEGYVFLNWTGSAVTMGMVNVIDQAETTVTLLGNAQLQANFIEEAIPIPPTPAEYMLTLSSSVGGHVIVPGEGVHGPYTEGTLLAVQAAAEPGYVFGYWTGTAVTAGVMSAVNRAETSVTLLDDYILEANFIKVTAKILYVDDNGRGDPAPGDALIGDPQEDGTPEHPFDRIQEAIAVAGDGGTIKINPGMYVDNIDFQGKAIAIIGLDPNDPNTGTLPVIYGAQSGPVVRFSGGEGPSSLLMGLALSGGQHDTAGGIVCHNSHPTISHCLITGNRSLHPNGAAILCTDSNAVFIQCTIADNTGGAQGAGLILQNSDVVVQESIMWGNQPQQIQILGQSVVSVQYSNIEDSFPGIGNLNAEPAFVQSGVWTHIKDTSLMVEPHDPMGQWIPGDYHLQAQAGRWHDMTQSWLADETTSVCVDAGDPIKPVGYEQQPHGDRINMGAYGGTVAASQSFVLEDDGQVHFEDDILKSKVQETLGIWWDPTPDDMLALTNLFASYSQIRDLSGLQYAKNLQILVLRWNMIDNISVLSGLTELIHLDLSQNDVSDLSPLSKLVKLEYINLHWNEVEDLTPLSQLTSLTYLMLKQNHVEDISALSGLNNLEDLFLNANFRIKDISPLAGKTKLTNLSLQFNDISDLSVLSALTQLEFLYLNENKITDLTYISHFRKLKLLNVKDNPLDQIVYVFQLDKISTNNPGIDLRHDPNPY